MSIAFDQFDREAFRKRIAKITDSELIRYGQAAKEMFKLGSSLALISACSRLIRLLAMFDKFGKPMTAV